MKPVKSGQKTRSRPQGRAIDDVLASLHLSSSSDSDEDSDSQEIQKTTPLARNVALGTS